MAPLLVSLANDKYLSGKLAEAETLYDQALGKYADQTPPTLYKRVLDIKTELNRGPIVLNFFSKLIQLQSSTQVKKSEILEMREYFLYKGKIQDLWELHNLESKMKDLYHKLKR